MKSDKQYKKQLSVLLQLPLQLLWENAMRVLTQDRFAYAAPRCMYRGPAGTKCAVGHSIPDSAYDIQLEHHSVRRLVDILSIWGGRRRMLVELQYAHDSTAERSGNTAVLMADLYYSMMQIARARNINTAGWV